MKKLLKTCLLGLCAFLGIVSFCNSDNIEDLITLDYTGDVSLNTSSYVNLFNYGDLGEGTYCINITSSDTRSNDISLGFVNSSTGTPSNLYKLYNNQFGNRICLYGNKNYLNGKVVSGYPTNIHVEIFKLDDFLSNELPNYSIKLYDVSDEENPILEYSGLVESNWNIYYSGVNVDQGLLGATKSFTFYGEDNSCPSCPSCPNQYTSLECQSEYSLIPISSVNQSYCESNNLCPVCTPVTGDLIFSNVYINDILHPGRPSVFVNIPDYIFWDYSVNDSEFNIYVGSGYDVDYIDSIVAINSYRPSSEDFTNVFVGGLTLIMPYVVIILFVVFIRKFIKRIFK